MPKAINRDHFAYVSSVSWRVLTSVEICMRNHAIAPLPLIHRIAHVNQGGSGFLSIIKDQLIPAGLLAYEVDQKHNTRGYRLTNRGYDYLALHQLTNSEFVYDLGSMIGSGKESDVYLALAGNAVADEIIKKSRLDDDFDKAYIIIKFHRLGRTSFRKVKEKREYHHNRQSCSWLYLDRLSAKREYEVMQSLYEHSFPIPTPIANNRNAVVMEYLSNSETLCEVPAVLLRATKAALARHLYLQAVKLLYKCVSVGFIHGDFNEFNLMVQNVPESSDDDPNSINVEEIDKCKLILIDFPQMISRDNKQANDIYNRDLNGITSFFGKFFDITDYPAPLHLNEIQRKSFLDVKIKLPGYIRPNIRRRNELEKKLCHLSLKEINEANLTHSETEENSDETSSIPEFPMLEQPQEEEKNTKETSSDKEQHTDDETDEDTSNDSNFEDEIPVTRDIPKYKKNSVANQPHHIEIRSLVKREKQKQERRQLTSNVKKQMRVHNKQKFRDDIKAEYKIFGL